MDDLMNVEVNLVHPDMESYPPIWAIGYPFTDRWAFARMAPPLARLDHME
jgi:hypothetical protein